MSEVAVCPRCDGEKKVYNARSGQSEPCSTCNGEGVVWRGKSEEGAEQAATEDHMDLTYRR